MNAAQAEASVTKIWEATEKTTDATGAQKIVNLPDWACKHWQLVRMGLVIARGFVKPAMQKIIDDIIAFGDANCGAAGN